FGGGHFGGGGGHVSGGHFGGSRGGWYGGHDYGHYRHNFGGYGYYPYYDYGLYGGYSYPYNYDNYSYPTYDSGYSGQVAPDFGYGADYAAPPAAGYQQQLYPFSPATAQPDATAQVTVNVPADARVWFEGMPTTSTGPVRHFQSPSLTSGSRYNYDVRASWNENGHEVTQTQQVEVTAGARVNVSFPVAPKTAAAAPAAKK
ncbi:MAG TPA: TIGR03000 domain-containing protein, partial [Gemmataceae bacterium]|nr:TIGR03000 domain-containing protein [Gemmataceae bacterium]